MHSVLLKLLSYSLTVIHFPSIDERKYLTLEKLWKVMKAGFILLINHSFDSNTVKGKRLTQMTFYLQSKQLK